MQMWKIIGKPSITCVWYTSADFVTRTEQGMDCCKVHVMTVDWCLMNRNSIVWMSAITEITVSNWPRFPFWGHHRMDVELMDMTLKLISNHRIWRAHIYLAQRKPITSTAISNPYWSIFLATDRIIHKEFTSPDNTINGELCHSVLRQLRKCEKWCRNN